MLKKRHHKARFIIFFVVLVVIYFLVVESPTAQHYIDNPELIKDFVLKAGILAPLAIIFLQFFQTIISIVPSQLTTIVAGFIFGPILGLGYSLIGSFLGSMVVFLLAKKYGKGLALKFFEERDLTHFQHLFKQKKLLTLFLARIAPLFPNDLVSFGAGLTKTKLRNFNLVSTLGFIVQMVILTYFGSELASGEINSSLIVISIAVSALFMVALFEKQIKRLIIKDFHKIEGKFERK